MIIKLPDYNLIKDYDKYDEYDFGSYAPTEIAQTSQTVQYNEPEYAARFICDHMEYESYGTNDILPERKYKINVVLRNIEAVKVGPGTYGPVGDIPALRGYCVPAAQIRKYLTKWAYDLTEENIDYVRSTILPFKFTDIDEAAYEDGQYGLLDTDWNAQTVVGDKWNENAVLLVKTGANLDNWHTVLLTAPLQAVTSSYSWFNQTDAVQDMVFFPLYRADNTYEEFDAENPDTLLDFGFTFYDGFHREVIYTNKNVIRGNIR